MKKLPRSNAKTAYGLLEAVKRVVLDEPKRLDMGVVCLRGEAALAEDFLPRGLKKRRVPGCGTVGCIAGWSLALKGRIGVTENNGSDTNTAATLLGLDCEQERELFWAKDLTNAKNKQTLAHARATVEHITTFQKKYEPQLKATLV